MLNYIEENISWGNQTEEPVVNNGGFVNVVSTPA
jgi:hypothetical protein